MTYNTKPRPKLSAKQRQEFLELHDCRCCWCQEFIAPTEDWDIEHELARELGGSDGPENTRPIHRDPCHKAKTAMDRKLIAKSNRIRKKHGLDPITRKPRPKMRSRGFARGPAQKIANRPFPKRGKGK